MPMIQSNGAKLNAQIQGHPHAPVLMLCNSLGTDLHMWDDQAEAITQHFRLLRYDRRGHGKSEAPKGPYNMEMLARDALAVMDGMGVQKVNWCGLSMGGMVGMWLGANAAERMDRVVLSNTSAWMADKQVWDGRFKTVRTGGMAAIADGTMERWFTDEFKKVNPVRWREIRDTISGTTPQGFLGCATAIQNFDYLEKLATIKTPTMVICGDLDEGTPPDRNKLIASKIPGGRYEGIAAARHLPNVERPEQFNRIMMSWLAANR